MARLNLGIPRTQASIKEYLGKAIFFCEGQTEYNYFNYFARILNERGNKFTDVHIELRGAEGNAQTVLNRANEFYEDESNRNNYFHYKPYLVFDCDDPQNIQEVIANMALSENGYVLLVSNLLFELWLLMHFEEITAPLRKKQIYDKITDRLRFNKYGSKEKANEGTIRAIVGDGKPILEAIKNAKKIEDIYDGQYKIENSIEKMNPYSSVYNVMELIINEIGII